MLTNAIFYVWGVLKDKLFSNKLYSNKPHTADDLKASVQILGSSAVPAEFRHAMNDVFVNMWRVCVRRRTPFSASSLNVATNSLMLNAIH